MTETTAEPGRRRRYAGKLADPEFRRQRARTAAIASHTPHATLNRHVKAIVDRAGDLTPEQRDRLATLLRGSSSTDSGDAA